MNSDRNSENRVTEMSEISRSVKSLARDLDITVIALSQLNRAVENRNNKRPLMSDLRESGALEQDADLVAFVYRDEYYNETPENKGLAEVNIAKHRNGKTGKVKLHFASNIIKFENLADNDPAMSMPTNYEDWDLPRPTTAIIDLSSIEHNFNVIKKHCPKSQIYSVVKSNAYGHGVKKVVGALKKSDGFCVATIEEADEFREFSKKPLLCLQGFYDKQDLKLAHSHKLELVIHNEEQIGFLEKLKLSFPSLWLKFDTGMNRLGFMQNEIENMMHKLKPFSKKIVLMTHLKSSSGKKMSRKVTNKQFNLFTETT